MGFKAGVPTGTTTRRLCRILGASSPVRPTSEAASLIQTAIAIFKAALPLLVAALLLLFADRDNRIKGPIPEPATPSHAIQNAPSPKRVAIAYLIPEPGVDAVLRGLRRGLAEQGYIEGVNYITQETHAQGEISQISALGDALEASNADVIVTLTTPVLQGVGLRAQHKPVVFTYVVDPLAAGAGTSLEQHLPHLTGIGSLPPVSAMIDLIQEVLPSARHIGTLYNPAEANAVRVVSLLREAIRSRGLQLTELPLTHTQDAQTAALALISKRPDVVVSAYDNTFYEVFDTVSNLLAKAKIPLVIDQTDFLERGALMALGVNFEASGHAAAAPLIQVLQGQSPAEIPFRNLTTEALALNFEVAQRLGLSFPEKVRQKVATSTPPPLTKTTPWKIQRLIYAESAPVDETLKGMDEGFAAAGLVAGQDFILQDASAQADMSILSALADQTQSRETDLIIALSTPTLETLIRKIKEKPIVFTFVANPVVAGAGTDETHHLPNVTGIYTEGPYAEMADLLKAHFPHVRTVGTLFAPNEDNSVHNLEVFKKACRRAGIDVLTLPVNSPSELPDAALALAAKPMDAWVQILDNQSTSGFSTLGKAAHRFKKPLFAFIEAGVRMGASLALSMDYRAAGFEAALRVAEIMRGRSPGEIPFSRPSAIRLVINPDHAANAGLTLPHTLIEKADLLLEDPSR